MATTPEGGEEMAAEIRPEGDGKTKTRTRTPPKHIMARTIKMMKKASSSRNWMEVIIMITIITKQVNVVTHFVHPAGELPDDDSVIQTDATT